MARTKVGPTLGVLKTAQRVIAKQLRLIRLLERRIKILEWERDCAFERLKGRLSKP